MIAIQPALVLNSPVWKSKAPGPTPTKRGKFLSDRDAEHPNDPVGSASISTQTMSGCALDGVT